MIIILPGYIRSKFLKLFVSCLISVIMIYLVVDLVENLDQFLDRDVPNKVILLYYLYYVPYITVLTMPVATLLASVFSVGIFARHNELVAMKSLGYSMYRVARTLLGMGLGVSLLTFFLSESVTIQMNRKRQDIRRTYLSRTGGGVSKQLRNLEIQEPPDKIVTIGYYDDKKQVAKQVKIETFQESRLVSRLDSPSMQWNGQAWVVSKGYQRIFDGENEKAHLIDRPETFHFQFDPAELILAQIKPEEMKFLELYDFVGRVRELGGEGHRWLTDFHLRIAFPMSNLIIVFFSIPIAYNRRKKSLTVGFGISLLICFFYFGLVKMGQTMGQKGSLPPFWAAWLGNNIMGICSVINVIKTRK